MKCPTCSKLIADTADFCAYCGTAVRSNSRAGPPGRRTWTPAILIVRVLTVGGLMIAGVLSLWATATERPSVPSIPQRTEGTASPSPTESRASSPTSPSNLLPMAALADPPRTSQIASEREARKAFTRDGDIYVMNADGTGLIRLTKNPTIDDWPSWSAG